MTLILLEKSALLGGLMIAVGLAFGFANRCLAETTPEGATLEERDCPGLRELQDRGSEAGAAGDHVGAEAAYQAAVAHCRGVNPNGTGLAYALYSLGEFHDRRDGWNRAKPLYEQSAALFISNRDVGAAAQDVLYRLAVGEERAGQPKVAAIWWGRAAELLQLATTGSEPTERGAVFLYYAAYHFDVGELQAAEIMYQRAIQELDKAARMRDAAAAAKAHAGLALVFERTGRSREAEEQYELAMKLWGASDDPDEGSLVAFPESYAAASQESGNSAAADHARAEARRVREGIAARTTAPQSH